MISPLSRYHASTPLIVLINAGVIVALMFLGDFKPVPLVVNWLVAGLLSGGIWHIVARFSLEGGAKVKAFAISWPLLALTMNFSYCYFPHTDLFYKNIAQLIAILAILTLFLSLWQRRQAILKHLLIGLIIGLVSTLIPHALLWLLLIPMSSYFMRSWSTRNFFSALTGTAMGIWMVYIGHAFFLGIPAASTVIGQYSVILAQEDLTVLLQGMGVWQYLFLAFTALLLMIYSITTAINSSGSVRASASIQLISLLSCALVFFLFLDLRHLTTYLCIYSLFLGLQLTIHQANLHSAISEWCVLLILLIVSMLTLMPAVMSIMATGVNILDLLPL